MEILEKLRAGHKTFSLVETHGVAAELAEAIPENTVLTLSGDLGAGKTAFVQGLAKAWGVKEPVTSPTFALYSLYHGSRILLHLDAYRMEGAGDGEELLIEDVLESPWCIAVEWPERIQNAWWLENAWRLDITSVDAQSRVFTLVI